MKSQPMRHPEIDQAFNEKLRSLTGLVPKTEVAAEDVYILGYQKSGTNWLRNLIAGVIYGADPEYAPYALLQDLIPNRGQEHLSYYKRYGTPTYFKVHDLPRPQHRRVVYIYRDGRDVMVSYFHHLQAIRGREVDFLKVITGGERLYPYCKWHEHIETWLTNPYEAQMLVMRYEDLKKDPVNELRRFCAFAGVARDDAYLELMAQKASFAKMRQKEIRDGGISIPSWSNDKFFVRRGEVGSYKDEMPAEVLAAFLADAEDTLRKLGYL